MTDYVVGELIPAKNGALRDPRTGRIVANPGGGEKAITPANSSAYHQARREKMRQAASAAIARATNTRNSIAGLAYGIEMLVSRAVSGEEDLDKSRKALLTAGRVAGLIDDTRQTLDNDTVQSLAIADSLVAVRDIIHELVKSNGTV